MADSADARTLDVLRRYYTRRRFLRLSAFVAAAGPAGLEVVRSAPAAVIFQAPTTLKPRAQYVREAAAFESAFRDFQSAAAIDVATVTGADRFVAVLQTAGGNLDGYYSWLVAAFAKEPALEQWVRRSFPTAATLSTFLDRIKQNPRVVDELPGVASTRSQLEAQLRDIKQKVLALKELAARIQRVHDAVTQILPKVEAALAREGECVRTWSVVTAVLTIVSSLNGTLFEAFVGGGPHSLALPSLATKFRGTGADAIATDFAAYNRVYQQCVGAAQSLPAGKRAAVIARCQVTWLDAKMSYLG